jgi:hypothetical protein
MADKTFKPDEGWGGKEVEDPLLLGLCLHVFDRADLQLRETKGSHGGKKKRNMLLLQLRSGVQGA